jgi:hypothetical protein
MWIYYGQIVALGPFAALYLTILEIANDILIEVLKLQTACHFVEADTQLLFITIVHRLNKEVFAAMLLFTNDTDLYQAIRVRHLSSIAAFSTIDDATPGLLCFSLLLIQAIFVLLDQVEKFIGESRILIHFRYLFKILVQKVVIKASIDVNVLFIQFIIHFNLFFKE